MATPRRGRDEHLTASVSLLESLLELLSPTLGDRKASTFVALDGRSGAGKSTLAIAAAREFGVDDLGRPNVTVIVGDEFYGGGSAATWDQRSVASKVENVIDWQRQRSVLTELRSTGTATWRTFDWNSDDWDADTVPLAAAATECHASPIVLLEGAYSARPELADLLDLRVLLNVAPGTRQARLRLRDGDEYHADWAARWTAAEDHYFGNIVPPNCFDLVLQE